MEEKLEKKENETKEIKVQLNKTKEINNDKNPNLRQQIQNKMENFMLSWGFSKYGQTGHEKTNLVSSPTYVNCSEILNRKDYNNNLEDIDIDIITGESHSGLLVKTKKENYLYTFGKNCFGQLGLGNTNYTYIPKIVRLENKKIIKVSMGGEHTLLLTEDNNIYSCGLNLFGQLGLGDNENRLEFTKVNFILKDCKIKEILAGSHHSIITTNNHSVYYCGFNKNNFLNASDDINHFMLINDSKLRDKQIYKIRVSLNITGILFEDKQNIYLFGQGNALINDNSNEIIIINIHDIIPNEEQNKNINIKDFKLGVNFIIIFLSNGEIYTRGDNTKNVLGVNEDNTSTDKYYNIKTQEQILGVEVGYEHVIVVSKTGKIYGWGNDLYGQICQRKSNFIPTPSLIQIPTNFGVNKLKLYKISCGGYFTISLYKGVRLTTHKENKENIDFNLFKEELITNIELDIKKINDSINLLNKSEQLNNELSIKHSIIDKKLKEFQEIDRKIGVVPENDLNTYSRGFENSFEIPIEELTFDDEEGSEIGKGTFGYVLKGTWRGEDVAVKFLKGSMAESKESIKQFIDECNILKNLHHPNILLYMGSCTIGPQYFFVTEFCENGNLFEVLHIVKGIKLNYEDVRRIALEIAYGMNYLHGFHPPILHRDLKSMNVLLDRNLTVKLADFGNTRSFQVQMTKQKGTFQWMAPEVIRGCSYTEKSDVFSFGIIMNELVTRAPPYQGTDKKDVAKKVVNNPNYRPPFNPKKVPKDWSDLMIKCWQHDEKNRPTFSEIIELLLKAKLPANVYIKQP